jgi:hypothetical protein
MPLYYIDTDFGCGLRNQPISQIRREEGQHLRTVRRATEEDIDWVTGMGGYNPKEEDK